MIADKTPMRIVTESTFLGQKVGRLSFGCWRMPGTQQSDVAARIDAALSIGANIIDTAAIYGFGSAGFGAAESMLGQLITERPSIRDEILLVTKGGITPPLPYNSTREHIVSSCEASLTRLCSEQVDLFLIHRPDLLTGHQEVAAALEELVTSGKARAVGVSNYSLEQTRALQHFLTIRLSVTQPEISPWQTDALFDGTLDHAQASCLLPMAWSPLAGGLLATGIAPAEGGDRFANLIAVLDRLAKRNETTRDIVALAWLLVHPSGIVPILGTQSIERIKAAEAAYSVEMNRVDWYEILEASLGQRMP